MTRLRLDDRDLCPVDTGQRVRFGRDVMIVRSTQWCDRRGWIVSASGARKSRTAGSFSVTAPVDDFRWTE